MIKPKPHYLYSYLEGYLDSKYKDNLGTSFYEDNVYPGFFTPFNEKHGIKKALISLGYIPCESLLSALMFSVLTAIAPVMTVASLIDGDFDAAKDWGVYCPVAMILVSAFFVFSLLNEVTAFFTRSIATLTDMCNEDQTRKTPCIA